jgi:predicted DCC family thiol-disulfide oxidoreductase YuxK
VVYIRGDEYFQKSTAALYILKDIGGLWKLMYVFIIVPKFLRDAVYDLIARSRYRLFGKRLSCMIPTAEIRKRFLE